MYPVKTHGFGGKVQGTQGDASYSAEFWRGKDYGTTPEGQTLLALAFQKCHDSVLAGQGDWVKLEAFMQDSKAMLNDLTQAIERVELASEELARAEQVRAEQARAEQARAEQSRAEQSRAEQARAEQAGRSTRGCNRV